MKLGRVALFGGAIALAAAVWAPTASAATLVGDYQFQGTRASGGPGAALTHGVAGGTACATESVFGTSRQVLTVPQHSGVKLSPTWLSPTAQNSIVTTFRLATITGYRRIVDYSNGASDDGIYDNGGF